MFSESSLLKSVFPEIYYYYTDSSHSPLWERYSVKQLEEALQKAKELEVAKKKELNKAKTDRIAQLEKELETLRKHIDG